MRKSIMTVTTSAAIILAPVGMATAATSTPGASSSPSVTTTSNTTEPRESDKTGLWGLLGLLGLAGLMPRKKTVVNEPVRRTETASRPAGDTRGGDTLGRGTNEFDTRGDGNPLR